MRMATPLEKTSSEVISTTREPAPIEKMSLFEESVNFLIKHPEQGVMALNQLGKEGLQTAQSVETFNNSAAGRVATAERMEQANIEEAFQEELQRVQREDNLLFNRIKVAIHLAYLEKEERNSNKVSDIIAEQQQSAQQRLKEAEQARLSEAAQHEAELKALDSDYDTLIHAFNDENDSLTSLLAKLATKAKEIEDKYTLYEESVSDNPDLSQAKFKELKGEVEDLNKVLSHVVDGTKPDERSDKQAFDLYNKTLNDLNIADKDSDEQARVLMNHLNAKNLELVNMEDALAIQEGSKKSLEVSFTDGTKANLVMNKGDELMIQNEHGELVQVEAEDAKNLDKSKLYFQKEGYKLLQDKETKEVYLVKSDVENLKDLDKQSLKEAKAAAKNSFSKAEPEVLKLKTLIAQNRSKEEGANQDKIQETQVQKTNIENQIKTMQSARADVQKSLREMNNNPSYNSQQMLAPTAAPRPKLGMASNSASVKGLTAKLSVQNNFLLQAVQNPQNSGKLQHDAFMHRLKTGQLTPADLKTMARGPVDTPYERAASNKANRENEPDERSRLSM